MPLLWRPTEGPSSKLTHDGYHRPQGATPTCAGLRRRRLPTIPDFALVRNGGTHGDPVLRGMFGSRLKILTNGGSMLDVCAGRMDTPTAYIAPETYDKLDRHQRSAKRALGAEALRRYPPVRARA